MERLNPKAQAGTEYLIVVAIGILLLTPVIALGQRYISDFDSNSEQLLAKQSLDKIADSAKLVYSQGEPAKITLLLRFPGHIDSAAIEKNTLKITLQTKNQFNDIVSIVNFPINGTLPTTSGRKKISVEAKTNSTNGETYVEIY